MGNSASIINETGKELKVLIFNNSDIINQVYASIRIVPVDGSPATVTGAAGGGAVKVGVISKEEHRKFFFDLFRVKNGAVLKITNTSTDGTVKYVQKPGIKRLNCGQSISVSADPLMIIKGIAQLVRAAVVLAVQVGGKQVVKKLPIFKASPKKSLTQ